jgi:hypothetical protein
MKQVETCLWLGGNWLGLDLISTALKEILVCAYVDVHRFVRVDRILVRLVKRRSLLPIDLGCS